MPSRSAPFFRPRASKGVWFPICLSILVLAMLPGALLLLLSLLGFEGWVNAWLQDNLRLSYHNSLPRWATILLLLLPIILAILYFLKLRRKSMEVPSTFLWRKSIEDLHVNSLFQWLRDNILLLVQLCIILLLIYSGLQFQIRGGTTAAGKNYIILIDSSASMAVSDVRGYPDRLAVARNEALKLIDAHGEDDSGMVIEFNSRATILQPYTKDKSLLRQAVNRIKEPTKRTTRIDEAFALADSLANPQNSTENQAIKPLNEDPAQARDYVKPDSVAATVHLFSDGRFPDVPGFAAGNLSMEYHRIGAPTLKDVKNVGIVNMNAVRDEKDSTKMTVFVRVLNYGPERAEVVVELEYGKAGDFKVKEVALKETEKEDLRLPARVIEVPGKDNKGAPVRDTPGERAVTFDLEEIDETVDIILHARLKNHRDQFALDDQAWLVAGVVRKARVLIVTPGNDILMNFFDLDETKKVAAVTSIKPAELTDAGKYLTPARAGEYDLVIFDRCAPSDRESMPLANTFFIDSVPPPWLRKDMPPLKGAVIRNPASSHPLMRDLTGLDEIGFSGAFRFDLRAEGVPPRIPRLLEADRETALLFVLPRRAFQDLVLAFPLVNDKGEWATTWNLKLSFPVFLRNILYQLGNVSDAAAEENVQPGDVKVLRPETSVPEIEVTYPKSTKPLPVKRGSSMEFAFKQTDEVGVYMATWKGGGRAFTVNLLDAEESNTLPRDEIKFGNQDIQAGGEQRRIYETWKWVALGALALLLLEWAMYHRRAWF
jgi:hypothetical protein